MSTETILEFMERYTTLHWQVQVLYVVDGFEATLEYDGTVRCCGKAATYIGALQELQWQEAFAAAFATEFLHRS